MNQITHHAPLKEIYGEGCIPKLSITTLDPLFIEAMANVMMHGEHKYGSLDWHEHPIPLRAECDALMRHLLALLRGEYFDGESGECHATHIACRAMKINRAIHQSTKRPLPYEQKKTKADGQSVASGDH